jgi:hypothetical protein
MRERRSRGRRLVVLLVALGAACHSRSSSPTAPVIAEASAASFSIRVANHNWSDVVVYMLRDGQPTRLGVATAASSASFVVPRRLLGQAGEIQLWGRPIGGRGSAFTETVVVQPGQWVEWTLESDLNRSAVGVY